MTPESLRLLAHIFAREPDAELALLAGGYGFAVPGRVTDFEVALPPPVPALAHDHISRLLFIAAELDPADIPPFLEATLSPWIGSFCAACTGAPALYATAAPFVRAACP